MPGQLGPVSEADRSKKHPADLKIEIFQQLQRVMGVGSTMTLIRKTR
jgi:hypothetical protein